MNKNPKKKGKKKKEKNKISHYLHPYVLPFFVTNCQKAIKTHHQKEVAEVTV